jgi:hypothetical protein
MTNKQKVLAQYPDAHTFQPQPGTFRVDTGNSGQGRQFSIGGSASSAWKRAAQEMGAQNARDTNSPFMLAVRS